MAALQLESSSPSVQRLRAGQNTTEASLPQSAVQASELTSSGLGREEAAEEFICPISLELMVSPVVLLQTRQVYDNTSFTHWLSQGGTTCPLTGVKLQSPIVLRPYLSLRKRIEEWAGSNGESLPPAMYGQPSRSVNKQKKMKRRLRGLAKDFLKEMVRLMLSTRPYLVQVGPRPYLV